MTDLDKDEVRRRCKEIVDAMAPFLTFSLNPFETITAPVGLRTLATIDFKGPVGKHEISMLIKHLEFCRSLIGESEPPPSKAELVGIITTAVRERSP